MRMRFVYHHRTSGRGGEGVHIGGVVRALRAAGHHVDVVSPPGIDPLRGAVAVPLDKGAVDISGIVRLWKWISCFFPQALFEVAELLYNVYAAIRLVPLLCRRRETVYYERYAFFLCAGVWLAKWFGKPIILEVNEAAGMPRARPLVWVRLARWFERQTFSRADEVLTVSSVLQQEVLRRGGRAGHVHVVANAIDPARFHGAGGALVRERLGFADTSVIGFVGWFDDWDRLDRLIDLLKELHPCHPAARLLLVGGGPVAQALAGRIAREGLEHLVVLTGPVARADVPNYIDAMDICILPDSNAFGSPIVLFEFMAMAKPVIGPDLPPIRDVVVDGETGWIVDRNDPAALFRATARILNDAQLGRRVGEAARRQVLEHHTWDAVGRLVAQVAMQQLERRAAGGADAVEAL